MNRAAVAAGKSERSVADEEALETPTSVAPSPYEVASGEAGEGARKARAKHRQELRPDAIFSGRLSKAKMKVYLESSDARLCDAVCKLLVDTAKKAGATTTGMWPLESSADGLHRRLVIVPNPSCHVLRAWQNLTLPSGIDVVMKPLGVNMPQPGRTRTSPACCDEHQQL